MDTCIQLMALLLNFNVGLCAKQSMFSKRTVPSQYVAALPISDGNGDAAMRLHQCISLCAISDKDCQAISNDDEQGCRPAKIKIPAGSSQYIIADELAEEDKTIVFAGKSLIQKRVGYVANLVSLSNIQVGQTRIDSAVAVTGVIPSIAGHIPAEADYDHHVGNWPAVAMTFPGGFVSCGYGKTDTNFDNKCRKWDFRSKSWSLMPGGMTYGHAWGVGVHLQGKLYVFLGSNLNKPYDPALPHAESFDLVYGEWELLPDAPFATTNPAILDISDTEILLAMGAVPGCCYKTESYIYNTETRSYSFVGYVDAGSPNGQGLVDFKCGRAFGSSVAICAGGNNEWIGGSPRVHRFDILNKQWLPHRPSDDLPDSATLGFMRFVTVDARMHDHIDKIYLVDQGNKVFEVSYDDTVDGPVTVNQLNGVTSDVYGIQLLFPSYYDEIMV